MGAGFDITLPWPSYRLSQNGQHGNPFVVASARKAYAKLCAKAVESFPFPESGDGDITLTVRFHPPTATRVDLDNGLTRLKKGIDAIAEAWGVNDNRFEYNLRHGEKTKGGRVVISLDGVE